MEQPVSAATVLTVSHFPPYQIRGGNQSGSIGAYLKRFMASRYPGEAVMELPSLLDLSDFFRSPHLEVYDAFRSLRGEGFDYTLTGLDKPLYLWRQ